MDVTRASFASFASSSSSGDEEDGRRGMARAAAAFRGGTLPSAAAIAGLAEAGGTRGRGPATTGASFSYLYDSFLSASRKMPTQPAVAGDSEEEEDEEEEGGGGGGGGLRHALGVIERLQEQLRIVRGEKQGLEERLFLLQRENAHLLGQQSSTDAAAMAAAEMKAVQGEAQEARERLRAVEGQLESEREEGRAVRARLASGACLVDIVVVVVVVVGRVGWQ